MANNRFLALYRASWRSPPFLWPIKPDQTPGWTEDNARKFGEQIGVDWETSLFTPADLLQGMYVELEHGSRGGQYTNVTNDHPVLTAMIALVHLREGANYYELLAEMETRLERPTV